MLRQLFYFTLVFICPLSLFGQSDTVPTIEAQIKHCRQAVILEFEQENRLEVQYWLDSLQKLESTNYMALQWDERWLLYIWLENYTALLNEVEHFSTAIEAVAYLKSAPPQDSLFERLDSQLYEDQGYLFDQIRKAWLSTEERGFTTLLLNYLLRLSTEEEAAKSFDAQLNVFLKQYPTSRFAAFIRSNMYNSEQPADWAIGLDFLFLQGSWSDGLERSFRPLFGGEIGLAYWRKRWTGGARLAIGGQKLDRDLDENQYIWPEEDPSTFFAIELETGYDIYSKPGLRIYPCVGGGFSTIHPPEDEEDPNPDYYDHFKFNGWHLTAGIQADVKFGLGEGNIAGSYHGVRVRLGYRWLNLKPNNPAIQGNMFFFAIGYTLFSRQAQNSTVLL